MTSSVTAQELWEMVKAKVASRLSVHAFATWIEPWQAARLSEEALSITAPTGFHLEWLELHYADLIADTASECLGRSIRLDTSFPAGTFPKLPADVPSTAPAGTVDATVAATRPKRDSSELQHVFPGSGRFAPAPELNERYTFSRFVVGANVQLAAAAAKAVADKPAISYNPLFLYGGVGLGKTHLMHAIGHRVYQESGGTTTVLYISSERFVNEVIGSIQQGTMSALRRRFREIDLLLVDDVHFLAGKDRTQEEFFHTFNALYDSFRQIVLTSDRPPQEIPDLEARLVSRFEMGLVVDVKAPDFETRMAILRTKSQEDGLSLDDDVLGYIAETCTASVRHLEGAVIKLLALSSLTHRDIDLPLARHALPAAHSRASSRSDPVSPDSISRTVADHFNIPVNDITSKSRKKQVVEARQIAMFLIKKLSPLPLSGIGSRFGDRDHSTVSHSIRKVRTRASADPEFAAVLRELSTKATGVFHD